MSLPGLPPMTPEQLAVMPLMPNPSGDPPNFVNPDTVGPQAMVLVSIVLALTSLVVVLRVWSRSKITKSVGLDDACAVISLLCIAAVIGLFANRKSHEPSKICAMSIHVFLIVCNKKLFGPHAWDVRLVDFVTNSVQGVGDEIFSHFFQNYRC